MGAVLTDGSHLKQTTNSLLTKTINYMKKLTCYRCSYNQLFSVLYIAVSRQ